MENKEHAPGGWLERRLVLPVGGRIHAIAFACAAQGRVFVRSAVRHVRVVTPGGADRVVLLPGTAEQLWEEEDGPGERSDADAPGAGHI
jgi:hypothetical protein